MATRRARGCATATGTGERQRCATTTGVASRRPKGRRRPWASRPPKASSRLLRESQPHATRPRTTPSGRRPHQRPQDEEEDRGAALRQQASAEDRTCGFFSKQRSAAANVGAWMPRRARRSAERGPSSAAPRRGGEQRHSRAAPASRVTARAASARRGAGSGGQIRAGPPSPGRSCSVAGRRPSSTTAGRGRRCHSIHRSASSATRRVPTAAQKRLGAMALEPAPGRVDRRNGIAHRGGRGNGPYNSDPVATPRYR